MKYSIISSSLILSLSSASLVPQNLLSTEPTEDVSAQQAFKFQEEELVQSSLMDSIFGDLIHDEQTLNYKLSKLNQGQLQIVSHINSKGSNNDYFKMNKVKFPDDDDLSDFQDPVLYTNAISFAHLPQGQCFSELDESYDIAIVGAPFDLGVSYAPGTRFGPNGVRQGSRRLGSGFSVIRGNSPDSKLHLMDPYHAGLKVVDCGDIPMMPFDARIALNQLYRGQRAIHKHTTTEGSKNFNRTRIVTLGGDHTITFMNIKSAYETFIDDDDDGLAVIHFDAHIDTWDPKVLGGGMTKYASLNHGTFLHYASEAGYLSKNHSVHVGIRAPFIAEGDEQHDIDCGFQTINSKDVDLLGTRGVARKVKEIVGDRKVYISFDLDTFDAGYVNSGTLEAGGLNSREIMTILDGLEGLNIVGVDIVEVNTPPYGGMFDTTGLLAAQVIDSLLGLMTVTEL